MSNLDSDRFYELFRKQASLEKRPNRLEDNYHQLDNIVDPQDWIGEAFKLQEEDLDTIKTGIKTLDRKLDIIIQHITGVKE
jgi:hypothetical protein